MPASYSFIKTNHIPTCHLAGGGQVVGASAEHSAQEGRSGSRERVLHGRHRVRLVRVLHRVRHHVW